jgi:sugar phosphate isomerase/epimerase
MIMPTVALSTGSLHTYGIARSFELGAEAGFDAMEVLVDHRWDCRQPAYLRRLCQETGLPIIAVHSPFVPYVPSWPHDPVGRLQESAALAGQVGAGVVVAHLPLRIRAAKIELYDSPSNPRSWPLFLPARRGYRDFLLNGLARFEATEGVRIGVENMPAHHVLGRRVSFYALNHLEALAAFPHLTLDTTHLGTWGLDPVAVYERLRGRVIHVHLSNFNGQQHRLPEDGHLPLGTFLQRLAQDGYKGAVSVEIGPEVLQAEDEAKVREHLKRAVGYCREHSGD